MATSTTTPSDVTTIEDLLGSLKSGAKRKDIEISDDFLGERYVDARQAALDSGIVSKKGHWTGPGGEISDATRQIEEINRLKERLEEHKSSGRSVPEVTKTLEKDIRDAEKELSRNAKQTFREMGRSQELHNSALTALEKRRSEALKDLGKSYKDDYQAIVDTYKADRNFDAFKKSTDKLDALHRDAEAHIHDHFDKLTRPHNEHIEKLVEVQTELEGVSGLKASEHMSRKAMAAAPGSVAAAEKGVIGEAAYSGKGFFGKRMAEAGANWKSAGGFGKVLRVAGTGVGVIIGLKGLKDVGRFVGIVSPEVGEDGKERPADAGNLIKGVGELGVGAAAAYASLCMGGKGKAMGH